MAAPVANRTVLRPSSQRPRLSPLNARRRPQPGHRLPVKQLISPSFKGSASRSGHKECVACAQLSPSSLLPATAHPPPLLLHTASQPALCLPPPPHTLPGPTTTALHCCTVSCWCLGDCWTPVCTAAVPPVCLSPAMLSLTHRPIHSDCVQPVPPPPDAFFHVCLSHAMHAFVLSYMCAFPPYSGLYSAPPPASPTCEACKHTDRKSVV